MVTQPICLADLVSLAELGEAFTALERARRNRRIARNRVMTIREALDHVLDEAFRRQSFAPLEHLFRREEMALENYDETVWQMARAEQHWSAVLLAFAQECDLIRVGPPAVRRMN